MDLSSIPIPTVYENAVTNSRWYGPWVFYRLPRKLREGFPLHKRSSFLLAKSIFLGIAGIPNPVDKEVGGVENAESNWIPAVRGRIVICKIQGRMAVCKRNSSYVPENEHEAPFLVVHIP